MFKNYKLFSFMKYMRPYYKYLIVSCLCCISCSVLSMAVPIGIGRIIDLVNKNKTIGEINCLAIIVIICLLLGSVISFIGSYMYSKVNNLVLNDIRIDMFKHISKLPLNYFSKEKEGNIISHFLNDINAIQRVTTSLFLSVITDFIMLGVVLITLFSTNFKLGILSVITMMMFVFILKLSNGLRELSIKNQENLSEITSVLQETILGIRTIKLFTSESIQINLFKDKLNKWFKNNMKLNVKASYSRETGGFYTSAVPIIFLCYGAIIIKQGQISVGQLVTYYTLLGKLYGPCSRLTNLNIIIQTGLSAIERILEFLTIEEETSLSNNMTNINGKIELRDVWFEYEPNNPVLKGINFNIDSGQIIGIVGRSGAGKSTIIDLIMSVIKPQKGEILVDDININNMNIKNLRENISIVSQDIFLFNSSIMENIRYGNPYATEDEIVEAAKVANAHEFIEKLPSKYETIVGNRGHMLSVGQCQRISIARAIIKNPKIIILDEATSALDATSQRFIKDAMFKIMNGKTCIIISHRLSILSQCDKIYVLDNGSIVEKGDHKELMKNKELYWRLLKEEQLVENDTGLLSLIV